MDLHLLTKNGCRDATNYLGLTKDAKIGDVGFQRLARGKKYVKPRRDVGYSSRRKRETRKFIGRYQKYLANYNKEKQAKLATI